MAKAKSQAVTPSAVETDETRVFEMQVRICKAFAHVSRLRMLDILGRGERSVSELQKELGLTAANVSQHLAILKSAGCIATRREGKQIYCSLTIPEVRQACCMIRDVLRARVRDEHELVS